MNGIIEEDKWKLKVETMFTSFKLFKRLQYVGKMRSNSILFARYGTCIFARYGTCIVMKTV